jgi:redox-sensitive bicupin YhaK (pirin superfamily)
MTIAHVELKSVGSSYELALPEGWTCICYVRRGAVALGRDDRYVAGMFETAHLARTGGDGLVVRNVGGGKADVLVLAGEPIRAPVVASGTMVMNSQADVQQALVDYQRGDFGTPWPHELDDEEWARACDARARRQGRNVAAESEDVLS